MGDENCEDMEDFIRKYPNCRKIEKVLIANNGLAAVKCLISLRQWILQNFKQKTAVKFVCMATPNEMKAASQYLRLADDIVMCPGGKNTQNFANVEEIVTKATENKVDAVYVGWGHASENPELAKRLLEVGITFIGPSENAIVASGDKIVSTIIAQSLSVPTVSWSGSHVKIQQSSESLDYKALRQSVTISNVDEGLEAIDKFGIGFPMMIKASEGGGGKGIRKCTRLEDFHRFFKEVSLEVPNSPIFLMKCIDGARHVEVQIIADNYGDVLALSSRDCTIQRRCQKVIEEAPASIVPKEIVKKMQEDAIRFAKYVSYSSAGTLEFLYLPKTQEYFFLELNPRLQVEHPCTEAVCDVNIPSIQLQVAIGLKLDDIPEVVRYKERKEKGIHCIAARVTCEDANDRFLPSSGVLKTLKFQATRHSWAYFSIDDGSLIHEFADSQIGHVFAEGRSRNEAISNLKFALSNLKIDATFPTQVDYLMDLIGMDIFRNNEYDTQWLDRRIMNGTKMFLQNLPLPTDRIIAIAAAAIAKKRITQIFDTYQQNLQNGKIILPIELDRCTEIELMLQNVKYSVKVYQENAEKYQVRLKNGAETMVEMMKSGADNDMIIAMNDGNTVEYQLEENDDYYMIMMKNMKLKFPKNDDDDASVLRSPYTGKFLGYKASNGESLKVGQTYAQIESMKIVFDVVVKIAPGRLIQIAKEGDIICPGSILGRMQIDETTKKADNEVFRGSFDGWKMEGRSAREKCELLLDARGCMDQNIEEIVENLLNFENHGDEHLEENIAKILEKFIKNEEYFNPKDSFDENVKKMMQEVENREEIVERIYANTKIDVREKLIFEILTNSSKYWRILVDSIRKIAKFRHLKRISRLSAEILFEIYEGERFDEQKCGNLEFLRKENEGIASYRCLVKNFGKFGMEMQLNRAIIGLQCVFEKYQKMEFVRNRVEIEVMEERREDYKVVLEKMREELEDLEIREVLITTGTSGTSRLFVNNIGVFLEEDVKEFEKPNKRDWKRSVARQNRTTYIYDFPEIFAKSAFDTWQSPETPNWRSFANFQEMVVKDDKLEIITDKETMASRMENGSNSCSVVAWLAEIRLKTPLKFVLIGSDITHQVGSFATPEHRIFELASQYSRAHKLPRINISCNSGARIGLARNVLDCLKVKLTEEQGFDYLYIDKSDKERIGCQVVYEEHGEELRLVAVKGGEMENIGVENLMGSGAIGGETSRAYREVPTYCYITGRSVGIGAYTARLARRIVQHEKAHMILTGAMALNTLLGKKVYASNNRLGGVEVMENNGIAHSVVKSDLEGVAKLVKWIGMVPQVTDEFPFFESFQSTNGPLEDVKVDRDDMQKDVRRILGGYDGKQGIFDDNTFDEICAEFAESVVVGRARLAGLAVGVVASQWKSFETKQLADESMENGGEKVGVRAGQVWYPDSAFKTSQAISDFNRENLPLILIASLRGFSGGRKDMADMVLTFGAHIIDELSQYQQPVIVYIPEGGELRGGAWAVLDSNVNRGFIHMIADFESRGGILEPNAICGIKIRDKEMIRIMERSGVDKSSDLVKNSFKKAAVEFADMHDRWQRMESVGAVEMVVAMKDVRKVFWMVLRKEMVKLEMARRYQSSCPTVTLSDALKWLNSKLPPNSKYEDLNTYYHSTYWNDVKIEVQQTRQMYNDNVEQWVSQHT